MRQQNYFYPMAVTTRLEGYVPPNLAPTFSVVVLDRASLLSLVEVLSTIGPPLCGYTDL
jgi:hypothetical protein